MGTEKNFQRHYGDISRVKIPVASAYEWQDYTDKIGNAHRVLRKCSGASETEVDAGGETRPRPRA